MASNDVNLGIGYASGMFYHAPENTPLPTYPAETLASAWVSVGDVSSDGVTWSMGSMENIKNWANKTVRSFRNEQCTVSAGIISTTEESIKTVFGASNVNVTPAGADHGKLISVSVAPETTAPAEAYLFIGKDGDDMFMIGTTSGIITELADVTFAPDGTITWEPTIEGVWTFMKDDGQVQSTT